MTGPSLNQHEERQRQDADEIQHTFVEFPANVIDNKYGNRMNMQLRLYTTSDIWKISL